MVEPAWTTRAQRPASPSAYVFTDRDAFEERIEAGGFLEWTEFLGNYYGTPTPEPGRAGADVVVLEIEVDGARQVKAMRPDAPADLRPAAEPRDEQERRLRGRGDPTTRCGARLRKAEIEEPVGRALADHVVVNDELESTIDEMLAIIEAARDGSLGDCRARPPVGIHPAVSDPNGATMEHAHDTMMNPPIEELLDRVDSKFSLVTLAARRARNINAYFNQLGDGLGHMIPPQVSSVARKPLSIGFEEIAADKIVWTEPPPEPVERRRRGRGRDAAPTSPDRGDARRAAHRPRRHRGHRRLQGSRGVPPARRCRRARRAR